MALSKERLPKVHRDMVMIRRFEEVIEEYAADGTIPGFVRLSIGQEVRQAGAVGALRRTDCKSPDHREHGVITLCGIDPKLVMAEILAKETGINHGRGGSMRVNDLECRNMGLNGTQGSTMVTYPGTAFASVYSGTDDVTAVFLGDGAPGEETCHESMNMAATWKPPIIYRLVNSGYAMSTRYEGARPQKELKTWGEGYEVPSFHLDENDIGAVIKTVEKATDHAREGEGPTVLEFMTYRWQGHLVGGPVAYRLEDKVSYWANDRDPLKLTRVILLERRQVEPAVLQAVEKEEGKHVQEMLKFSLGSEYSGVRTATAYTYTDREVELRQWAENSLMEWQSTKHCIR